MVQVNTVTYDMEEFLAEDAKDHPAHRPYTSGKHVECAWCKHTFNPDVPFIPGGTDETDAQPLVQGKLAPCAASALMKLLYAARLARFDLFRPINSSARHVTKWSKEDDKRLHHLMCYVNESKGKKLVGLVGDSLDQVQVAICADADFSGCVDSLRSTLGCQVNLHGKRTRFPLVGNSKRQSCASHSTPEAQIVAVDNSTQPRVTLRGVLGGGGSSSTQCHFVR